MGTKYYNSRGSNTMKGFVCKGEDEEGYIAMECTLEDVKLTEEEEMGKLYQLPQKTSHRII